MEDEGTIPGWLAHIDTVLDMDLALTLSYFELVFELHDQGLIKKEAISKRLRALAERQDLKLSDRARFVLRMNADGIDKAGAANG